MLPVIVLNPAIESQVIEARMAARLGALGGQPVAFLDNGKPMADVFLSELADVLRRRTGLDPVLDGKPDPSRVVERGQLTSLAARSRAIVTGVGD
jgi:hypothetical protein